MKRVSRFLIAAVMTAVLSVSAVFAENSAVISASDVSGVAGEEVSVDVELTGNPGFGSYTIELDYDSNALELTDFAKGDFSGMYSLNSDTGDAGFISMKPETGDGVLFTAKFKILAKDGSYDVTPMILQMSGADNEPVDISVASGSITVGNDQEGAGNSGAFGFVVPGAAALAVILAVVIILIRRKRK